MNVPRVGVIIKNKDRYLCVFQNASRLWGFPKGRLKYFEEYKVGACRELFEETGLFLNPRLLRNNYMIHIKRGKHHHFYYLFDINYEPNVVVDQYEIIDHKWMTLEELSSVRTSFFTEQVIRRLRMLFGVPEDCYFDQSYWLPPDTNCKDNYRKKYYYDFDYNYSNYNKNTTN